ncbi:MAG: ATP-binding protein [Defluviitaleaceae bacterium]|nr:ATP-binding protein [Defluviitaleaceae bacterium]
MKTKSITTSLIIALLVVIITATTAVTFVRATQVEAQQRNLLQERLQGNVNTTVGIFDTVRTYNLGLLNMVATLPQVEDALFLGGEENIRIMNYAVSSSLAGMRQLQGELPMYANIVVFNAELHPVGIADPDAPVPDLHNFLNNAFMAQMGLSYVSSAVECDQTGLMQFLFTQPVMRDGTFYGMVAIPFNTQALGTFLRDFVHDYDSFVNVADDSDIIFFSNRPDYVGRHVDDLGVVEAFGYMRLNRVFNHMSAITGIEKVAYITTEPDLNWTIVSFFDAHAVESIGQTVLLSLVPTVSGILVAAALIVFIVARSLKPLKSLAVKSREVASGNLDVEFESVREDEIGQVFDSFQEVVTSLRSLIDEAKSASKAKGDFLAKMSHEIRTPMNAIIGMAELALREDLSPTVQEYTATIKNSGSHLLKIINDILDFSKIESGNMEVLETEYLFHSTINDVVSIINARMSNPNVQFVAYMERNVPNKMLGDEVRLRQVLLNILSNSVKYTQEGRITLNVTWQKSGDDSVVLTVSVKDTGIGIKPEDLQRMFGEFQQFDLEKNRNVEGTGLGLAITNNLVRLMGGEISVASTYGLGSIFTLSLPQKLAGTDDFRDREELTVEGDNILLTGRIRVDTSSKKIKRTLLPDVKILIVDDVATNLQVAKGLLSVYEAKIDVCLSGKDAIERVRQNSYDLIFMDHMMPEMDGLEATAAIRKLDGGKIPVIALSANAVVGAREMFLQNGLDDFISKPIETEKLDSILMKWIPKAKQLREISGEKQTSEISPQVSPEIPEVSGVDIELSGRNANFYRIEGVNVAQGIKLSGGSIELYKSVLEIFYQDGDTKISQIKKSLEDNDLLLYTTYVHAVKSACANIGAIAVSKAAAELEAAGNKSDRQYINANNPALLEEFKKLLSEIARAVNIKTSAGDENFDVNELNNALLKLKTAMQSFNPIAIDDAAAELGKFASRADIRAIIDCVFVSMYPEAESQIDAVLAKSS